MLLSARPGRRRQPALCSFGRRRRPSARSPSPTSSKSAAFRIRSLIYQRRHLGAAGSHVVYKDAIIDLSTIHEISALHSVTLPNVAYSVALPPSLAVEPVFQNSVVADMSGTAARPGAIRPPAAASRSSNSSPLLCVPLQSSIPHDAGTGGISAYSLVRNVSGLSGWTDQIVDAIWTEKFSLGTLQQATFNVNIGMPVAPAAPVGSLYAAPGVGKGAIQPAVTRQTVEPGDDLTTTPCPYNYVAKGACMPSIAGDNVTASGSWSSSASPVSISVPNCNGVIGGMSVVDTSLATPVNIGFVQSCSSGTLTVAPATGGSVLASNGASDALSIGAPIYNRMSGELRCRRLYDLFHQYIGSWYLCRPRRVPVFERQLHEHRLCGRQRNRSAGKC